MFVLYFQEESRKKQALLNEQSETEVETESVRREKDMKENGGIKNISNDGSFNL